MDEVRKDGLLGEYRELCTNFRTLTDIRFKLIGLLPVGTALTAALGKDASQLPPAWLSFFGLAITAAVATYNERNNQIYDDLVKRAAAIERSLNIPEGAFAHRPGPWLGFPIAGLTWLADHRFALMIIYAACAALWLFLLLARVALWVRGAFSAPSDPVADYLIWAATRALLLGGSIGLVALLTYWLCMRKRNRLTDVKNLQKKLRKQVVGLLHNRSVPEVLSDLQKDEEFLKGCKQLAATNPRESCQQILGMLDECGNSQPSHIPYYMPTVPAQTTAAYVVSLLSNWPERAAMAPIRESQAPVDNDLEP